MLGATLNTLPWRRYKTTHPDIRVGHCYWVWKEESVLESNHGWFGSRLWQTFPAWDAPAYPLKIAGKDYPADSRRIHRFHIFSLLSCF